MAVQHRLSARFDFTPLAVDVDQCLSIRGIVPDPVAETAENHTMRKIGEGDKSEVFVLPDGRILKLFFDYHAALAPVEAEISASLARAGVAAPRVDEVTTIDGRPGLIFVNLSEGKTLGDAVRSHPWRLVSAARELADLHTLVHERKSKELPSQRQRLEQEIRDSDAISHDSRQLALELLATLPDGENVCHNDIHMLNVIQSSAGLTIIDWVLATRGNPLADVAGAVLQLRFGEQPNGFVARAMVELGRIAFRRAYLQRYLALHSAHAEDVRRWELPVAAALSGRRAGRMRSQLVARVNRLVRLERSR